MRLYIEYEAEEKLDLDYEETARCVAEAVLQAEGFPYEGEVDLVLTSDEEVRRINREFRGIDAPTDVLSFPAIPFEEPCGLQILAGDEAAYRDPDTGDIILGDIMISVPKVMSQAAAYGHSVKREYAFLVAHSMLHLLGYDHMEEAEAQIMEEKQENILKGLKIDR